MRHCLVALVVLLALAGCRDEQRTDYIALSGRIFVFNPRVNSATYVVTLDKLKQIPAGARVITTFDNPAGGAALVVEQPVWPKLRRINIESPDLSCVKKDKRYSFKVKLVDAAGATLQELDSSVLSTLDQSVMPDAPLVVGPAYDKNPDLKGSASGKIDGFERPACPA
jgi:hypothetical protein